MNWPSKEDLERWYEEDVQDRIKTCPECGHRMKLSLDVLFNIYVCDKCGYECVGR